MTIIKYKIWDIENSKWFIPTFEAYKGNLEDLSLSTEGELLKRTIDENIHESCFPNKYKVVQFSGLKDENRVEIYEYDYVMFNGIKYLVKF